MSEGFLLGRLIRDSDGRAVDFVILDANPACEKLTGLNRELLAGRRISEIAPGDEPVWLRHISEVASSDMIASFEEYSASIDKWLKVYAFPLNKDDMFAVIIVDITERRQAEEALRRNEAFLNNVFDSIQDGISVLDRDLNIVRMNHIMEEWYSHMMPLKGKKCYHVYHGRSVPCDVCPSLRAIRQKEMQSDIVPFHDEHGEIKGWQELYAYPLVDESGNVTGVIEHVRDITKRKRAEESLFESEVRFRTLFENAGAAIVIVDEGTGLVMDCNSNAEKLLGHSRNEILGISVVQLHPPDKREKHHFNIVRQAEQGHIVSYEAEVLHKSGRKIPVIINAAPVVVNGDRIMMGFILDITERKRTEEALRESEEMFRALAETASVAICILQDGKFQYVNPAMEAISGYTKEELGSIDFIAMVHPEALASIKTKYRQWLAGVSPEARSEFKGISRNGEIRWADVSRKTISYRGRPAVLLTGIDITERKRVEEALQRSEERYRKLTESSADYIYIIDRDFKVEFVNRSGAAALGTSQENVIGKTLASLFTPYTTVMMKEGLSRVFETGKPYSSEFAHRFNQGIFYMHVALTPIFDGQGNVSNVMGVSRDINDIKKAEEALRESEEKFRSLVENINDVVWETDTDGKCTYASPKAKEMMGYESGELLGKTPFDFMIPVDADRISGIFSRLRAGHEPFGLLEYTIIRKDGSHVTLETNGVPMFHRDGSFKGYRGVNRDITERKRTEKALRESEEKFRALTETASAAICILQDRKFQYINPAIEAISGYTREELMSIDFMDLVHPDMKDYFKRTYGRWLKCQDNECRYELKGIARNGDIKWVDVSRKTIDYNGRPALLLTGIDITDRKRAEDELREAKEQAELYVDLMGHDINNMHQMALGYLEIARDVQEDETMKALLDRPIEALQRSSRLIRNVRKLQRLREGTISVQTIDLCEILADLGREYGALPDRTVTVNLNGHIDCYVRADELLYDVFANLVGNGVKHTGGNAGISVSLDTRTEGDMRCYTVSVEDNGPGIPDSYKEIIFKRLLKGTTNAKGSGIGLYLVKSLVDSYHGKVWVEDRVPGDHTKGAKFVVVLPAAEQ